MAARTIFIIFAVLALGQFVSPTLLGKVHIGVENFLISKRNLELHCKSKGIDLGNHVIPPRGVYNFTFHNTIWGTTLYYCYAQWERSDGKWVKAAFNIYDSKRDQRSCMHRCQWLINEYGIFCFSLETKLWENMFDDFTIEDRKSSPNHAPPKANDSVIFISVVALFILCNI